MATTVFIAGASGLIGLSVAKAFKRQGYIVYGLVRSEEKAKALLREEIIPVYGVIISHIGRNKTNNNKLRTCPKLRPGRRLCKRVESLWILCTIPKQG